MFRGIIYPFNIYLYHAINNYKTHAHIVLILVEQGLIHQPTKHSQRQRWETFIDTFKNNIKMSFPERSFFLLLLFKTQESAGGVRVGVFHQETQK